MHAVRFCQYLFLCRCQARNDRTYPPTRLPSTTETILSAIPPYRQFLASQELRSALRALSWTAGNYAVSLYDLIDGGCDVRPELAPPVRPPDGHAMDVKTGVVDVLRVGQLPQAERQAEMGLEVDHKTFSRPPANRNNGTDMTGIRRVMPRYDRRIGRTAHAP